MDCANLPEVEVTAEDLPVGSPSIAPSTSSPSTSLCERFFFLTFSVCRDSGGGGSEVMSRVPRVRRRCTDAHRHPPPLNLSFLDTTLDIDD